MADRRAYLDHNATSPLRPEARAAMVEAMAVGGNASSVHAEGRAARKLIESARRAVAEAVGADPKRLIFTSGATEAAAQVLRPGFRGVSRLIVSAIEHSAVLAGGAFAPDRIQVCPVEADGRIDLAALSRCLDDGDGPAMVALMLANNETGVIQPVAEAAALVHARGGLLVCDAVQALGKVPVDIGALKADILILSGHKIGGPAGVGAIVWAGDPGPLPLLRGGGQEGRHRAGTENLIGIAGFGAAARLVAANAAEIQRITALRDWMEAQVRTISPEARILGAHTVRLGNTSSVVLPGLNGETAVIAFDLAGVSVATGSACSSGKVAPSHVLAAMGLAPDLARSAVRVSLGWSTTQADVEQFLAVWTSHVERVLARKGRAA